MNSQDVTYLNTLVKKREELTTKYPTLIGRHSFFYEQKKYIDEGMSIIQKLEHEHNEDYTNRLLQLGLHFKQARSDEKCSHLRRFQTVQGNEIHKAEEELYCMAIDVFLTHCKLHTKLDIPPY